MNSANKPHAVCIPFPAQGHINPMLKLSLLLHHHNFHITFINTDYNHNRLLRSRGPDSLAGFPDFHFRTIPDGLPPTDADSTQHIPSLCDSTRKNCLVPFIELLKRLNDDLDVPPVSCVISDAVMGFAVAAAEVVGVRSVVFRASSACCDICYMHCRDLVERGIVPLEDSSYLTNGYLDKRIDFVPGMKNVRLRDFPSFVRTTNPNDFMLDFVMGEMDKASKSSAIILNTFDALEGDVLNALSSMYPRVFAIGPLHLRINQLSQDNKLKNIGSSLWREEPECLEWLNSKRANSVLYVNFGSITVMTPQQLVEFAWGLANSKKSFLWIIRPDLVGGGTTALPSELVSEIEERGLIASWCPQEKVLNHASVGGFLTHCGWNSMMESLCSGVPMLCWPFFADQLILCRYACAEWGVGMEICSDVSREELEKLVRELMDGEKGKEMRNKALEWKVKAQEAIGIDGSSSFNLNNLIEFLSK
ncbi:hypothetical protein LguiB_025867 [Lonicera macranthoides]